MRNLKSYNVQLWVGFREQYTDKTHTIEECKKICQQYVDGIGDCVTITPTEYIYKNGNEPGVVIGWIQYPRFPRKRKEILRRAVDLGEVLKKEFNQFRITITTPFKSYILC